MKIAIIGYGSMGQAIERFARAQGHRIAAIVDPFVTESQFGVTINKTIAEAGLKSVDVAIEFTQPASAIENIIALAERKIPTIMGTTGWYERMGEVTQIVQSAKSALLWTANFSIGVNLYYRIAWYTAELINRFPEYDVGGFEAHHNKKLDSPSGTAKTLVEGVLDRIDRKNNVIWETFDRKPEAGELHFSSLRIGNVPGRHSLFFDSPVDTIEITHTARSREGFALGAIRAAQWLIQKDRHGVFTFNEMLDSLFTGN